MLTPSSVCRKTEGMETKTKKKKLVRVEIDRREWYRGKGEDNSALLKRNGAKCCLGFACLALGLPESKIRNKAMPGDIKVSEAILGLTRFDDYSVNSCFSNKAAQINDEKGLSERQRESKLKSLAKANGFQFIFTN